MPVPGGGVSGGTGGAGGVGSAGAGTSVSEDTAGATALGWSGEGLGEPPHVTEAATHSTTVQPLRGVPRNKATESEVEETPEPTSPPEVAGLYRLVLSRGSLILEQLSRSWPTAG